MPPLTLLLGAALAAPVDDPLESMAGRLARAEELHVLLGSSSRRPATWGPIVDGVVALDPYHAEVARLLANEWAAEAMALDPGAHPWRPVTAVRGRARLAVGDGRTQGALGDAEPGLLSPRLGAELSMRAPWWEARASVEVRVEALGEAGVSFAVPEAWAGLNHGPLRAGFGLERRVLGPARHGAMILGDDAWPFPAGSAAAEGTVWRLGLLRAELGAGWAQRPRVDVQDPGLLWMDLRWSPVPALELGASRASLFAGEGRPWPSPGQLLLPTDPHVEGDPERIAPDQDEIAALDARLTLPLGRWLPGVDYLEVYTQYGGDDMIMRSLGPLPMPSLAGIANLLGGELVAGPWALNVEVARLMDDRFRWYTGHRIYHQGFVQDGRPLGHVNGGDAQTWWGQVSWMPGPWGLALWTESVRRVGVVELLDDAVFTLMADERRRRAGLRGWWFGAEGWRAGLGYELEHVQGEGFVPGATDFKHRVFIELEAAPLVYAPGGEDTWRR